MSHDRFANERYVSWLTVKLSLQYAKEGLAPITEDRVEKFHNKLRSNLANAPSSSAQAVPVLCYACQKQDLKKQWNKQAFSCVNGICDGWLGLLQNEHVVFLTSQSAPKVEWSNFEVSRLPVDAWECAKVYLPYGSQHVQCAKDADLAAILTLYLNCQHFAATIHDVSMCKKVKEVRNKLIHSGTMEIDKAQMQSDVAIIKKLLNDYAFAADQNCQEAIAKIDKLLVGKLELSLNKELELRILNGHIKCVVDKTDQMSQCIADLTDKVQHLDQVKAEVSSTETELTNLKDQMKTVTDQMHYLDQLKTDVSTTTTEMTNLTDHIKTVTDKVQHFDQLKTHVSSTATEMTNFKGQLSEVIEDIVQLQKATDLFSSFINAFHNEKVDISQLTDSISRLSTLRDKAVKQGQILTQLLDTVGHHEVTLQQHGKEIDQLKAQLNRQQGKDTSPSDLHNQASIDLALLQQYLLDEYKDECDWENPVTADEQGDISQMYVNPAIKLIREMDENRVLVEVHKRQLDNQCMTLSYRQVFYTNTGQCRNIYITGDAGMGKTAFCKHLVHTWCRAVQTSTKDEDLDDDLNVLKEFQFLFYVNLREVESQYDIVDMIRENVLHSFATILNDSEYSRCIDDILKKEKCLVVLDGLDEWSSPQNVTVRRGLNKELPGRDPMNKKCAVLTTSRNWKFEVINLKTKDCDKHVELCGISEQSSKEFAEKMVSQLDSKSQPKRPIDNFFKEVQEKKLASVTTVPVLLTQLLTLWWFCKDLGKSQVQLYCKMLDLLFEQARKHLHEKTSIVTKSFNPESELPECFTEQDSCHNHAKLILCLSKLAFVSLLNSQKENSLVFKSSKLGVWGIEASDISLCLKCGILTQSKVFGNPTGRFKKYSFLHKKLQEFLAAVHLVSNDDIDGKFRQLKDYCDTVDTTLEMGQVLMFACGMKTIVGNQLLNHLLSVVSDDKRVQSSRHCRSVRYQDLIKNIQACLFDCLAEGASNELTYNKHIEDCWIEKSNIADIVRHVVGLNNDSIKSVYINTNRCKKEIVSEVLNHLQKVQTIEKILIWDDSRVVSDSILTLVITNNHSSLKSLVLHNVDLGSKILFESVLSCIPSLQSMGLGQGLGLGLDKVDLEELEKLEKLEKLERLMEKLKATYPVARVTHAQIEQLLSAGTAHLRQLQIQLYCTEHEGECMPELDLSAHAQLHSISIWWVCLKDLHAISHSIERVGLYQCKIKHRTLKQFIEGLEQTSHKVDVELWYIKIYEDSDNPVDLEAYLRECDKFNVTKCVIKTDKTWDEVKFQKK